MYLFRTQIIYLILFGIAGANFSYASGFYIPNLKCTLAENQFFTEIEFMRASTPSTERKAFMGTLANYVVARPNEKKLISSTTFKSVTFEQNQVIGLVGDEFGTTGNFKLINQSTNVSGIWQYVQTDLAGTSQHQNFHCRYRTKKGIDVLLQSQRVIYNAFAL